MLQTVQDARFLRAFGFLLLPLVLLSLRSGSPRVHLPDGSVQQRLVLGQPAHHRGTDQPPGSAGSDR